MKNLIAMSIMTCAFAVTAFGAEPAAAPRIGVSVDYTMVSMDQVNTYLNKGTDVTELSSGVSGRLDLNIPLTSFLLAGVRGGYLQCLSASARYNYILFDQTTTINSSLIPLEAGLIATAEFPGTPVSFTAGVYAGYGFASASVENEFSALGQKETVTQPYTGSGMIGEVHAAINFKVSPAVSLNLNGGYLLAKISQMEQTEDVNFNGIPGITIAVGEKGDILQDADNDDLAFDFSGLHIGLGLSLHF